MAALQRSTWKKPRPLGPTSPRATTATTLTKLQRRDTPEQVCPVGHFPWQANIHPPDMTVGRQLAVKAPSHQHGEPPETELLDYSCQPELEMAYNKRRYLGIGDPAGAEGLHLDADGARLPDRVAQLDLALVCEPGGNDVLGRIARGIGPGPVDAQRVGTA